MKFDSALDEYVYRVSLEGGCDDEVGSVSEQGLWYGLMRGHGGSVFTNNNPMMESLTPEDREVLTNTNGIIIMEDSQGFVTTWLYEDPEELEKDWNEILQKHKGQEEE